MDDVEHTLLLASRARMNNLGSCLIKGGFFLDAGKRNDSQA